MVDTNEELASLLKGAATDGSDGDADQDTDGVGESGSGTGEGGSFRAENTRLKQRIAALENMNQRALPFINFVTKIGESPTGKKIIDKFQKGEDFSDLLVKEQKEVVKAVAETTGLTLEQVKDLLDQNKKETADIVAQTVSAQAAAQRSSDALEMWAKEKFEGYENLRGTEVWDGLMDATMAAMRNGTLTVPEGMDPWKFAIERTYKIAVADDPEIAKKKPGASTPEDRAKDILVGGRKTPSSKSQDTKSELPEKYQRELDFIQNLGTGTLAGKSFANPGANKKK